MFVILEDAFGPGPDGRSMLVAVEQTEAPACPEDLRSPGFSFVCE